MGHTKIGASPRRPGAAKTPGVNSASSDTHLTNKRARPGDDQGQPMGSQPQPQPQQPQQQGVIKKPRMWIHFGPTYGVDTEVNQVAKDSAWKHIISQPGGNEGDYLGAIAAIENDAMMSYGSEIVEKLKQKPQEFVEMMAKDGCYFLLLALHILGAGDLLCYPPSNPYLGKDSDSSSWIPAMFYEGNQIPCVVIDALMKQPFFNSVLQRDRSKWQRPPPKDDLAKLALYQRVVEPHLSKIGRLRRPSDLAKALYQTVVTKICCRWWWCRNKLSQLPPPPSILHALHDLLLRSIAKDRITPEMRAFRDVETGTGHSFTELRSARELRHSSIYLCKTESHIQFKNRIFWASLCVPPLTINSHTVDLLSSIIRHEQLLSERDREVTAYISFIRYLAPAYKDFKILHGQKIIIVKDPKLMSNIMSELNDILPDSSESNNLTPNFRDISRKINDYTGPPWTLIGIIISAFTIIQTIFACFVYGFPRN